MTTDSVRPSSLRFFGGQVGLLAPFALTVAGIIWLGVQGLAIPEAFWPITLLGLFAGLLLARQKDLYVHFLIGGITSPMLATMLMAWFLAGILGKLLAETGVIEGLVWLALGLHISAAWFPLIGFLIATIFSLSTGTSLGTLVGATPILFPAGLALGANPLLLLGAIIGGAFVGDNLAPISDTTIVSAYSQGTEVIRVVRSRIRYATVAGAVTLLLYAGFALTMDSAAPEVRLGAGVAPRGLLMLLAPALLLFLMIRGQSLVVALLYSLPFGFVLGGLFRLLEPADILAINPADFTASGIVIDGIESMLGVSVFTIFLMALVGTLEPGGFIDWLMKKAESFATTARRAEISIVGITLLTNVLTTAGTPSMVILGPFVRRLGHKFRLAPWRRGNLLDACSTTVIGFLPYSVAVLVPFSLVTDVMQQADLKNFTPVHLIPYVFYCWALVFVIIGAAITGWGREFMGEEEHQKESRKIAAH